MINDERKKRIKKCCRNIKRFSEQKKKNLGGKKMKKYRFKNGPVQCINGFAHKTFYGFHRWLLRGFLTFQVLNYTGKFPLLCFYRRNFVWVT